MKQSSVRVGWEWVDPSNGPEGACLFAGHIQAPEVSGHEFKERSVSMVGCSFLTRVNMCGDRRGICRELDWTGVVV